MNEGGNFRPIVKEVVDRIMEHLKLTFVAEKPPPALVFEQVALMAAASACTHGDV